MRFGHIASTLFCQNSISAPFLKVIQEVAAHTRQVQAIKFSPNNRTIVSCGSDFKVKVIDIVYGTVVFSKCKSTNLHCGASPHL